MFLQGRFAIVWLSWLVGGICGVVVLLLAVCYCRLMPRHQKSFDEQYLKETYMIKENQSYSGHDYTKIKYSETTLSHPAAGRGRPASYAGERGAGAGAGAAGRGERGRPPSLGAEPRAPDRDADGHYGSSSLLDEAEGACGLDALKTRSLPAFLRPRPRPAAAADDELQPLYTKVNLSKKYKRRMRSEHAAIIALSKSHTQLPPRDAVVVYDQRTAL